MHDRETSKEHKRRIEKVIDFILKNINSDISLQTLAEIANYSPFHLQKLFKEITGESPKQYIIKVRLETALLLMVIHPYKSVKEISIDCEFSSAAVFSRAVKNYFGITPEEIRMHSPKERMQIFRFKKPTANHPIEINPEYPIQKLDIQIRKVETIKGFYLTTSCDDTVKIQESFKKIMQLATANDLLFDKKKIYGILSPHQGNIYKTFLAIDKHQQLPNKFNLAEIKGGKYVTVKIRGDIKETIKAGHFLYHHWLPENGYKIADIVRFEVFSKNPATIPYNELERELHMPIEPI